MYMSKLASAHFQFYVQFFEFWKTCSPNAVCYIELPKNLHCGENKFIHKYQTKSRLNNATDSDSLSRAQSLV